MDWNLPDGDPFAHLLPNSQRPFFSRRTETLSSRSDDSLACSVTDTVVQSPQTISPTQTFAETDPILPRSQVQGSGRTRYGTFPSEFNNWRNQYSSKASAEQASGVIYDAMQKWELEYEPVSELDSASSAYSAAFWDKNSNWVVISFKGSRLLPLSLLLRPAMLSLFTPRHLSTGI